MVCKKKHYQIFIEKYNKYCPWMKMLNETKENCACKMNIKENAAIYYLS